MNPDMIAMFRGHLVDPDPVLRAHARNRLEAEGFLVPEAAPVVEGPAVESPLQKTIRLHQLSTTCPYRTTLAGCGCAACNLAVACGLPARKAQQDCLKCVELHGAGYT